MPLGTEVDLGYGKILLDENGAQHLPHPLFGSFVLCPSQLLPCSELVKSTNLVKTTLKSIDF